jgi:mannuronan 5-epimerase
MVIPKALLPIIAIISLLAIYSLSSSPVAFAQAANDPAIAANTACITYDPTEKTITITCGSASLTDISNQLKDPNILQKGNDGEWLLNAGIVIAQGATLNINSTDTKWLKVASENTTAIANGIQVHGSLKVDSVKISSWNPKTSDYVKFEVLKKPREDGAKTDYDTIPRSYIRVEDDATGTTDITNSELAYLGYEDEDDGLGRSGLLYYGGDGSVVKGNHIHHLRFGFYSSGVGGMLLENNNVHDSYMYGFDPHTGTHDMVIRNNTVHDSGAMGIICSLDCFNITIEDNKVSNSFGSGIMFSRNMYDSVARNNDVHDESKCIFVSQSQNNSIYNNTATNCKSQGIYIFHNSNDNKVHDNAVVNTTKGIVVTDDSKNNVLTNNTVNGKKDAAGYLGEDEEDQED